MRGSPVSQDRMNKRECPHCQKPLGAEDDAWLQQIIDTAILSGKFVLEPPVRELSCGHRATAEAADLQGGFGFWLVPR